MARSGMEHGTEHPATFNGGTASYRGRRGLGLLAGVVGFGFFGVGGQHDSPIDLRERQRRRFGRGSPFFEAC